MNSQNNTTSRSTDEILLDTFMSTLRNDSSMIEVTLDRWRAVDYGRYLEYERLYNAFQTKLGRRLFGLK